MANSALNMNSFISFKTLIQLQDEYIKVIGAELNEVVTYADSHGWKSTRYEEGKRLREAIKRAKEELSYE